MQNKFNADGGLSINDVIDRENKRPSINIEAFYDKYGEMQWRSTKPAIETIDVEYTDVTNEPQHIAFLGHDLNHK